MPPDNQDTVVRWLKGVLTALDHGGVRWRILRNHDFLVGTGPYRNADLDILVRKSDRMTAHRVLLENGFLRTQASTVRLHVGYVTYCPDPSSILSLDLHIGDPSWNDVPYFPGSLLLDDEALEPEWWVTRPAHVVALLLLHCILDKKGFKPEYRHILEDLAGQALADGETGRLLSASVGRQAAARLAGALRRRDYDGMLRCRGRLIYSLLWRRPDRWAGVLACVVRSRLRRLRRWLCPPRLLVALVGPDGGGKSTVAGGLQESLKACGIPSRRFYMGRWHSHVLPLSGLARRHGAARQGARKEPAVQRAPAPADPVRLEGRPYFRLLRDAVYLLEMWLRYGLRIWPALRRPGVVLTDRYAYDLLLDPNATALVDFVVTRLYPRPDLCVLLSADADTLLGRKREQSRREIERQTRLYEAYRERLGWSRVSAPDLAEAVRTVSRQVIHRYLQEL